MSFEPDWGTLPARALRSESLSARSERGAVELFVPAPGVSVIRVAGRLETDLARQLTDAYEPAFAEARHLRAFMDCELMTGYDSEARSHLTQWVIQHRSQVRGCSASKGDIRAAESSCRPSTHACGIIPDFMALRGHHQCPMGDSTNTALRPQNLVRRLRAISAPLDDENER